MKQSAFLFSLMILAGCAHAQDFAKARLDKSPRHGEFVKVKRDSREVTSFVVYPEVKEKATTVVVIHEIFGLSDWARAVADEFAEAGYIAIAPDLLSGMAPRGGGTQELVEGGGDVRRAIMDLPPDQVTADLDAVVKYVSKLPASNGKVVVAGFCWGGGQAFRFATNNKDIRAALVFYGPPPDDSAIEKIQIPVYGFYGGNDARINATIPKTEELMKKAGKKYEPVVYEGAGHGFLRAGEAPDASPENRKGRDAAWKRMKEILKSIWALEQGCACKARSCRRAPRQDLTCGGSNGRL